MNYEIIKELFLNLSDLVAIFNDELKKGFYENIVYESNNIITSFSTKSELIRSTIVSDSFYGLNLELVGSLGRILFPSLLYQNSFRLSIVKDLKNFLINEPSLEELGIFLSKKSFSTFNKKKGGFNKTTLEVLRFYLLNYDKIIDTNLYKFLPCIMDYKPKYVKLNRMILQKKFYLTKKYTTYFPVPNFHNFGLNAVILKYNMHIEETLGEMEGALFGQLFNSNKEKEFLLIFSQNRRQFKNNVIERICFFENLNLFYKNKNLKKFVYKVGNILNLYYDFKDGMFIDNAFSFEVDFYNKNKFANNIDDIDILNYLFNTRKLPANYQIHPLSKFLFLYRNRVVNLYGTVNYFFFIYDKKHKLLSNLTNLIISLIRNSFSNGYIIQYKSGFLVSTYVFNKDFEEKKENFLELFHSLKLEVLIYENLQFIPFSFYQLPYSGYFNILTNEWNFPIFKDLELSENMKYQIRNIENERKRVLNQNFNNRVKFFLSNWTSEINSLI